MIEVKNVSKVFTKSIRKPGLLGMIKTLFHAKKEQKVAVDNISFTVKEGEIVGYIGTNGAGKSTTIKMMCGILTPTSGHVYIDGLEPYNYKDRNKVLVNVGVVFGQRAQLWWDLPLIESFNLYKDIYNIKEEDFKERFKYLTDLLDLNPILNSPVRTLSLGQRMKADLAAALIYNPKILFLDEPTIGLDILVKDKIIKAIKDINAKYHTTIILTTHDMSDIKNLCSRVIIIDSGKMLYDGTLENIKQKFGDIRHVYVLTKEIIDRDKINKEFGNFLTFEIGDDGYLEVIYDAYKVSHEKVLSYVLKNYSVIDLKISTNSLTRIVKTIYEKKSI